ncbi:MAG: AlpA family phage regulatory protein [Gammaproteobacteria bacterium]|jgi:prophage regulatory protein|nr:AlpA family phage regulatory protein [Gammaproteobacteria bacterium]
MLDRFLRRDAVESLTGLSRSAIYAAMRAGTFPSPVRIGKSAVAWRACEIEDWQAARIAATRLRNAG